MLLGAHESIAGGLHRAIDRATNDRCRALQIFTKNSGAWKEPALTDEQIAAFRAAHRAAGEPPVLTHTSYLINLASDDAAVLTRSKDALVAEVLRSSALGVSGVVLHPGAHLGAGSERALGRVADALDEVLERTASAKSGARILLENTAGQGTCVGCTFAELGAIFAAMRHARPARGSAGDRVGVCFDTQHAFAMGYDLRTVEGYDAAFAELEREVGLERLRAFHLNDSKKPLGSRVDRHEHIGEGLLGLPVFHRLANDARFAEIPAVIEVEPRGDKDRAPYKEEVALLQSLVGKKTLRKTFAKKSAS